MPHNSIALPNKPRFYYFAILAAALFLLFAVAVSLQSPKASSQTQAQFANPAFQAVWERTDGPVAAGSAVRGWVWGPAPGIAITETFTGIPGDNHLVQYFDKGRMEINDPNADKNDPFYVTNGLLAEELISGLQQTGMNTFNYRGPAAINLASDADDPSAPTYQSFNGVSNIPSVPNGRRATSAVGQPARTAIDRLGRTQAWPQSHPDYGVIAAYFEPATGHNIPDVFWNYLNGQGKIIQDSKLVNGPLFFPTFAVTGYPISEPYWSYVKVEGIYSDVLIQAYERRVLTYVPRFQVGYKVQMGNIGQHYYQWRYGNGGGVDNLPPKPAVRIDGISYRKSVTDLNGNYAIITNGGQTPVSLVGWRLDSPKWDHVDRFSFPRGTTLAPGASLRVHSGPGQSTATDVYMFRTTVMWDEIVANNQPTDGAAYNLAILYDTYGREVARFFPAAEVGAPQPTESPAVTVTTITGQVTGTPTATVGKETTVTPATTVSPKVTSTPTSVKDTTPVPTPVPTGSAALQVQVTTGWNAVP